MTDERCDDLWRRALDMGRARWMPGMLALRYAPGYRDHRQPEGRLCSGHGAPPTATPAWDDPATVGCLLALVRERHPRAGIFFARQFFLITFTRERILTADSAAEALLRALVPEEDDDD